MRQRRELQDASVPVVVDQRLDARDDGVDVRLRLAERRGRERAAMWAEAFDGARPCELRAEHPREVAHRPRPYHTLTTPRCASFLMR